MIHPWGEMKAPQASLRFPTTRRDLPSHVAFIARHRPTPLAATFILLSLATIAQGYGPTIGHKRIISDSLEVLDRTERNRQRELDRFLFELGSGAEQEDGLFESDSWGLRGPWHFHNPYTSRSFRGLNTAGLIQQFDALPIAVSAWENALAAYKSGDKIAAYNYLGHVAHLATGDMFQPAHVHDDPHAPHVIGGDSETIESRYDSNPGVIAIGALPVRAPVEGPLTDVGVSAFGSAASQITYQGSVYGGVIAIPEGAYTGEVVATISFDGGSLSAYYVAEDNDAIDPDKRVKHLAIDYESPFLIGDQPPLLFDYSVKGDLGIFLSGANRHQDWWELPSDEEGGGKRFYFDQYYRLVREGQRLDDYYIQQFVPQAISYTAGLLESAAKAFDSVKPLLVVRQNNEDGALIQPGGYCGDTIWVRATDPAGNEPGGDPAYPTASGVYLLTIKDIDSAIEIEAQPRIAAIGEALVTRVFNNIADGNYELHAIDGLGNDTSIDFKRDITPPAVEVYDDSGRIASTSEGAVQPASGQMMEILIEDLAPDSSSALYGSGPAKIEIWKDLPDSGELLGTNSDATNMFAWYDASSAGLERLDSLPNGQISVRATDQAGNVSVLTFELKSKAPLVNFQDGLGRFAYKDFRGISHTPVSTLSGSYSLSVKADPGLTLDSFELTKDGEDATDLLPANMREIAAGTDSLDMTISLATGSYQLTVYDSSDVATTILWDYAELNLGFGSAAGPYSTFDGTGFTAHIDLAIASSLGIASVSPSSSFELMTGRNNLEARQDIVVEDSQGNTTAESVIVTAVQGVLGADEPFTAGVGDTLTSVRALNGALLPGAVVFTGDFTNPFTGDPAFSTVTAIDAVWITTRAGSLVDVQPIGHYDLDIKTGGNACHLLTDTVIYDATRVDQEAIRGITHSIDYGADSCPILAGSSITFTAHVEDQKSFAACLLVDTTTTPNVCKSGIVYGFGGGVAGSIFGQSYFGPDPPYNLVNPDQSTAHLASSITLTGLRLSTPTALTAAIIGMPPYAGYIDLLSNTAFGVFASPAGPGVIPSLISPMTVSLPYASGGLTNDQQQSILVVDYTASAGAALKTPVVSAGRLSFEMDKFGAFKLVRPYFLHPSTSAFANVAVSADQPVTMSDPSGDPRALQLLNVLATHGVIPIGGHVGLLKSDAVEFGPPALVGTYASPGEVSTSGTAAGSLSVRRYRLEDASPMSVVGASFKPSDPKNGFYNGLISSPTVSLVGVFGVSKSVALPLDLLPPQSALLLGGKPAQVSSGIPTFAITSTMAVSFASVDPAYPGASVVSGVAAVYAVVDAPFVSTVATPGSPVYFPLLLGAGQHTITFYARDNAGNTEVPRTFMVEIAQPQGHPSGGESLGVDAANRLWAVVQDVSGPTLVHHDQFGNLLASAPLVGADASFPASVLFDSAGGAYAVASAPGTNGVEMVAVYKASPNGDAIIASRLFENGFPNHFALAAVSPHWILGAVQTGDSSFAAALWKFDADQGLLDLTTTYSRAGFDAFTGGAPDGAGGLWLAGFSRSPNPRSIRPIDLGVWRFSAGGVLSGPTLREGYLLDFDPSSQSAVVGVSSGVVFAAAPRARALGGSDLGFNRFDAVSGGFLSESAWRSDDGAASFPSAASLDPQGHLLISGGFDYGDGTLAGFWRYNADGTIASVTQADAGGARGAAFAGGNLWLAVDGSTAPYLVTAETAQPGALSDVQAPRTVIAESGPSFSGAQTYVSSSTRFGFAAADDGVAAGDGTGSGVLLTYAAIDTAPFTLASGSFSFVADGTHTVYFYSLDREGNAEVFQSTAFAADVAPPSAALTTAGTYYAVVAQDFVAGGVASGVGAVNYYVDVHPYLCARGHISTAPAGTCANPAYTAPFSLAPGTHTVYFQAVDNVGNWGILGSSDVVVPGGNSGFTNYSLNPATGPIGIPFVLSGPGGFGAYQGTNTRVLFGGATAPISIWNDASIAGTIPGLSTGVYPVMIAIGTTSLQVASFSALLPSAVSVTASSGPIGLPFTISGSHFGPYAGTLTRVLVGGTAAPISVWNDTTISGSIPGISTGTYPIEIQRATAGGGLMDLSAFSFEVVAPSPASLQPLSGPIGVPFAVTGSGFGPYAGTNTRILFDGVRAPVSEWNDSTIAGSIPNLPAGSHAVWIERASADGGLTSSDTAYFTVTVPSVSAISPSSGPIGATFSLAGESFGPYAGTLTQLLIGGATAPISVWNDTTITGTVPGVLAPGVQPVVVVRKTSDGGLSTSSTAYFQVVAPFGASLSPSTGPIGIPFTVTGTGFGAYAGTNTLLLIGDSPAAISVWNDTTISGTIPPLSTGTYPVVVERIQGGSMVASTVGQFAVTSLTLSAPAPSAGPVGISFTMPGSGFGPYAGTNTRVLLGGATVAVSVWNDSTISGSVPTLPAGAQPLWIERLSGGGLESSNTVYFQVVVPSVTGVSPSSGPIGIAFALSGSGFGSYAGTNTQVLIAGATAPISVWNDTTITGTIPGSIPTGVQTVVVSRRGSDGGVVLSAPAYFQVTGLSLDSLSPSTGPIGIPFTIRGNQFGTYSGTNTRVRFGAVTAAISVWNDTTITGTIPALPIGAYTVAVERQQGANVALSNSSTFTVTDYTFTGLTPSSGPIGVPFSITGSGFGPYAGTNTRVLIGGTTAAISVWNDAQISGTVPPVPSGLQPMWIERQTTGGVQSSDTTYFEITVPSVYSLTPSSAPIGAPFTIRGTSFGPYNGTNTRVKFNGFIAPISVWNDALISGSVPGALSTGPAVLVVERASGAGLTQSATQDFLVLTPTISTIAPASGTAGTAVTLSGFGFGPYAGTATKLLVNGSTMVVAVWNDSTIRWTVPSSLGNGTYPVVVVRSPSGGTIQSDPVNFTVGTGVSGLFAAAPLSSQPDVRFQGDMNLPASEGGRIQTPAEAAVEVPPGALDQDTEITVAREKDAFKNDRKAALSRDDLGAVGEAIQFGPEGTRFSQPVLIELPYDPALVPSGKLGEIAINYYDPSAKTWTPLLTRADARRHVLSARTDHFSLYQPLARGVRPAAGGTLEFADVYVFPNPARGVRSVTIRAQPGAADSISVRVYDLSGRKVYESSAFAVSGVNYDNVWDVGGVASGVYTFVVTAKKAGQADIHASGRIGVIK